MCWPSAECKYFRIWTILSCRLLLPILQVLSHSVACAHCSCYCCSTDCYAVTPSLTTMGNSSSKKQKKLQSLAGDSSDLEYRDCSPWRRGRSELGDDGDCPLYDVPGKPSKAIVSLTNLQSDKAVGSCVTDSIYLDWYRPPTDGGRPIIGYTVEMYDLPTGL